MNKDNYKKALDQIHVSDKIKNETFEKIKNTKTNKKIYYLKYLSAVAVFLIICSGIFVKLDNKNIDDIAAVPKNKETITQTNILPRFQNMEELRKALKQNNNMHNKSTVSEFATQEIDIITTDTFNGNSKEMSKVEESEIISDYSTTNIQVENVDEADIVKTDGDYIYYVTNNKIYIVKSDILEIISIIDYSNENKKTFSPNEIYINKDKLIVLGNYYEYTTEKSKRNEQDIMNDYIEIKDKKMAKAIIYDVSNKETPKLFREVALEGSYINSRMIEDDIYFISTKLVYYSNDLKDEDILPLQSDTAREKQTQTIECTDIAYFKDTNNYNYLLVGGFNINNNDEVKVETFFGASDNIYASEKNLYITQTSYDGSYNFNNCKTIIYKFNIENSEIRLQCKGEVDGYINNQFSMDEYDNNLRIATTVRKNKNIVTDVLEEMDIIEDTDEKSNNLIILDENLQQIGKIENFAEGESIYSVRFMRKIGYVVTFQQIDPLFVIDLSDPTKPTIKGELKIPGYSSYLHPYDETHIIGIGYNTEQNKYGGIINTNMKMSMFDVSDLENPKEMFSIDIGEDYANSNITNNHKVLFYNKNRDLIGFPINMRDKRYSEYKNGFVIFKINLDNGFEKYGEILQKNDYKTNIDRVIYIEDTLYTTSDFEIISYNLNTLEEVKKLNLNN